jgi:hypothetical protein
MTELVQSRFNSIKNAQDRGAEAHLKPTAIVGVLLLLIPSLLYFVSCAMGFKEERLLASFPIYLLALSFYWSVGVLGGHQGI